MEILIFAILTAVGALAFAALRASHVIAEDEGTDEMRAIAKAIQEGAAAFLKREYTFLAAFVILMFVILIIFIDFSFSQILIL